LTVRWQINDWVLPILRTLPPDLCRSKRASNDCFAEIPAPRSNDGLWPQLQSVIVAAQFARELTFASDQPNIGSFDHR
jgi:hypothetical protein